jgi:hypothetical protein
MPLVIRYVSISGNTPTEKTLSFSFAERKVEIDVVSGNKATPTYTIDWMEASELIKNVYALDYDSENAMQNQPKADGRYVDIGESAWYNLEKHVHSPTRRKDLVAELAERLERL